MPCTWGYLTLFSLINISALFTLEVTVASSLFFISYSNPIGCVLSGEIYLCVLIVFLFFQRWSWKYNLSFQVSLEFRQALQPYTNEVSHSLKPLLTKCSPFQLSSTVCRAFVTETSLNCRRWDSMEGQFGKLGCLLKMKAEKQTSRKLNCLLTLKRKREE